MEKTTPIIQGRYIFFAIAGQVYGVGIHHVREIVDSKLLEVVGDSSLSIRGYLDLRGRNIPVVDLRNKLGMEDTPIHPWSSVLTMVAKGWDGPLWMGLLVDGVEQVVQVASTDVEAVPDMEEDPRGPWLMGFTRHQDRTVLLLDLDKVAKEEVESIQLA